MQAPDKPKNEQARLNALQSLSILDTASEARFDRLTRLAQRLFKVPIALVSLVDEDRQWFKSCIGLPVRQTGRDVSFCGHAILGSAPLIVHNALEDKRFFDNPLVTDAPHIRFYAGCPIAISSGERVGTLCIIDTKPRDFSAEDIRTLKDLAEMAEDELSAVKMAVIDGLTGLLNRVGFSGMAKTTLAFCRQHRIISSLAFIDLDKFKLINDTYGHKQGDIALVEFSKVMQKTFRATDLLVRLGGDEFVILLIGANYHQAEIALISFRKNIERWNSGNQNSFSLAFSCGLVEIDINQHADLSQMLAEGDRRMYQQKQQHKAS